MKGFLNKVYTFLGRRYDLFRAISTPICFACGFTLGTCIRLHQWLGVCLSGIAIVLWLTTIILSTKSHRCDVLPRRHKEKSIAATTLIQRPSCSDDYEDDWV